MEGGSELMGNWRDTNDDEEAIKRMRAQHQRESKRNDHGRKKVDSCMVVLVLMLGGGVATVAGAIAAVKGLA